MSITTPAEMFQRELEKLYHAEIEILDLHADLSGAAASDDVIALFAAHRDDTVEQINRIERIFTRLDQKPVGRGSPIMEGLLAEKDELIWEIQDGYLRDLDALGIGMINERFEITVLDRLVHLGVEIGLEDELIDELRANLSEAQVALDRMERIVAERRVNSGEEGYQRED